MIYEPKPEYTGMDIIIIIDSSKTNSCMMVANKYGNVLDDYELRGFASDNILEQCYAERQFLSVLLRGANIYIGAIEDIITKKDNQGMQEHESRFKITAIFMSFISYFQDTHKYTLNLINNWAWKAGTLPEEFRTMDHDKGSLDYHKFMKTKYANRKDDVTDAYQILQYVKMTFGISESIQIEGEKELTSVKYVTKLLSASTDTAGTVSFIYNDGYFLNDVVSFMVNRLETNQIGCCKMPINNIKADDIYKYCSGTFKMREEELLLTVRRDG